MIKLGVTGGIGSGKTLVCSIISAMGYPVFNADLEARRIIDTDSSVILALKKLFGEDIYLNNQLNRKRVSDIVFNDLGKLQELNLITHPAVAKHFIEWAMLYRSRAIVVQEAAILFESGANQHVDKIISVIAPLELRIKRVSERDGLNREMIESRMKNQFPQDELIKRSDYIIENDGVKLILPQIVKIIDDLVKDL